MSWAPSFLELCFFLEVRLVPDDIVDSEVDEADCDTVPASDLVSLSGSSDSEVKWDQGQGHMYGNSKIAI